MLPTCRVHCAVFDNDGSPISGAVVTARLDRFEVYQGYVVPDIETATTDATGACVLALWPNALGATASSYAVKIVAPNGRTQRLTVTVPNVADASPAAQIQHPSHRAHAQESSPALRRR